jgi:squalene-associated FAD-dependent desaturase
VSKVHVVGAGVAGLAAAVELAAAGREVIVHEGAGHAGGRCRSFHDETLGRRIDNGNHLLLSGNRSARAYLARIGAADSLTGPAEARFPFLDLRSGERWEVHPNAGRLPWWIAAPSRRVPRSRMRDYLRALALRKAGPDATVTDVLGTAGPAFERFWEPLAVAVLNTAADEAAARLLWPVMEEIFGQGGRACRPLIAREGLSESFVDPALAWLAARGCPVRFNRRLRAVEIAEGRAAILRFGEDEIRTGREDTVVLALPAPVLGNLLPEISTPDEHRAIVNAHFLLPGPPARDLVFLGLTGGTAHWLFVRGEIASVTVSAADALAERPNEAVAAAIWPEVARALGRDGEAMPPVRIIKEKRATFAQTPAQLRRRPSPRTAWPNLVLAGDWTDTGLPATIEGAIRSGQRAAEIVLSG